MATGHIFPTLRSDVIFATSFFLARIVYPIALLPELFLNVESRLCWKVGTMALLVHVYWFHKFVQQQLRYHHARHATTGLSSTATAITTTDAVKVIDDHPAVPTVTSLKTGEESLKKTKTAGIVCEYEAAVPITQAKADENNNTPESPTASNDTFGMELPQIQINSSRHRRPRVVRLPSGQSIARLASFETSTDSKNDATVLAAEDPTIQPAINIIASTPTKTTFAAATTTSASTTTTGAKTMKQLLEECSDEDISTYKFPNHSNKTLSALATRKPMNGSQGLSGSLEVSRLSRASSMRDSKRRIALGSVQFASPSASASEPKPKAKKEPTRVKVEDWETVEEEETTVVAAMKCRKSNVDADMEATVVIRPRRSSPSRDGDYGFGTIRVSRGGVVAVNA